MKNKKYVIKHSNTKNYWSVSIYHTNGGIWVNDLATASKFCSKFEALKSIENFCLDCDKLNFDLRSLIKLVRLKSSGIKKVKPGLVFRFIDETTPCLVIKPIDSRILFVNANNAESEYAYVNSFDSSKKFWESLKAGEIEIIWQPS